jgi:hypothetical protein
VQEVLSSSFSRQPQAGEYSSSSMIMCSFIAVMPDYRTSCHWKCRFSQIFEITKSSIISV